MTGKFRCRRFGRTSIKRKTDETVYRSHCDSAIRSPIQNAGRLTTEIGRPWLRPLLIIGWFIFSFGFGLGLPIAAAEGYVIPDTSFARRSVLDSVTAPVPSAIEQVRELIRVPGSDPVFHRTEQQQGRHYYVFIPAGDDDFTLASPGTFIIRRRLDDGAFDQIKVFLQHDEGSYIRLFPHGRTLRMDVYIANTQLYRDVPVAMSMNRAITASTDTLLQAGAGVVDWSVLEVNPHHSGYAVIRGMVDQIRGALPYLPDAEDGAMDADGNLVYIESLLSQEQLPGFNCSGFAKWVIDGIYGPQMGTFLPIDVLREKHLAWRGTSWSRPLEDKRDPYFGLDWTRNLAVQMDSLDRKIPAERIDPEALDVRRVPFARYVEDVGYRVESLSAVLYWLARNEPGTFYLGSVNRLFGSDPVLRQHTHVVVLFPWFDESGRFQVSVMERNVETSLSSLEKRYGKDYIHLVRVRGNPRFEPPRFQSMGRLYLDHP
jgi:hypothetical protein